VTAAKIWNELSENAAFLFQRSFCCQHFSGPCHSLGLDHYKKMSD